MTINCSSSLFDARLNICHNEFIIESDLLSTNAFDQLIYGRVLPALAFIVIVTNTLVICVLSKHQMTSSTNILLMYLSVCVLLTAISPLPFTIYWYSFDNYQLHSFNHRIWLCYLHRYSMQSLPRMLNDMSTLLTVILALQRYV
jgi:hypothetical protein